MGTSTEHHAEHHRRSEPCPCGIGADRPSPSLTGAATLIVAGPDTRYPPSMPVTRVTPPGALLAVAVEDACVAAALFRDGRKERPI